MTTQLIEPATVHLPPLPQLNAGERAALETYCAELLRALSRERVKSVILYGSKARGDAHPDSDIDLLVILDPGDEAQKNVECQVNSQINMDYDVLIEAFAQSVSHAKEMQRIGSPLMQNIARDGVVLLGEEVTVNPIDTKRFVKEYMDSARGHLRSAESNINIGEYRRAVSDSYYACLDAADAALIAVGVMPRSHKGTLDLFSQKLVKPKLVSKEYRDIFEQMQRARWSADYDRGAHVTQAAAERALNRAKDFVSIIEPLLPSLLSPNQSD